MRNVLPFCLLGALPLGGCAGTTGPADPTGTFFEVEYVNFAWVPTWRGIFMDSTGAIYRYDLDGSVADGAEDEYVPGAALHAKWQRKRESAGQIGPGTFAELAGRVPAAADGTLTTLEHRCNDAGTVTYSAYRYQAARGAFRRVILRREGDIAQRNESAAARAIAERLEQLALMPRFPDCAP